MKGDRNIVIEDVCEDVCEDGMLNLGGGLVLIVMRAGILFGEMEVVAVGVMVVVAVGMMFFAYCFC